MKTGRAKTMGQMYMWLFTKLLPLEYKNFSISKTSSYVSNMNVSFYIQEIVTHMLNMSDSKIYWQPLDE